MPLLRHIKGAKKKPTGFLWMIPALLCALALNLAHAAPVQKTLMVITDKSNNSMSLGDVKRLFSLKQKFLPNKNRAVLIMPNIDSQTTIDFTQELYGLYPYQLQRIWDRAVFSGRGQAPIQKKNTEALIQYMTGNNDAVAFLYVNNEEVQSMEERYHVILLNK